MTDIAYVRTHEGWLYLAVVIDMWSRLVVGWSMGQRIDTRLVLDAPLMALWRRRPDGQVLLHFDQGCQYTGHEWQTFLRDHNLLRSMSRRGNCRDNAVAESFFQLLKRERIRRQIYPTRDAAKADVFDHIDVLQPDTAPFDCQRPLAGRVRTRPFQEAGKCLANPGRFKVIPCCYDYNKKIVLGNAFEQSVLEVMNGAKYRLLRYAHRTGRFNLFPYCD